MANEGKYGAIQCLSHSIIFRIFESINLTFPPQSATIKHLLSTRVSDTIAHTSCVHSVGRDLCTPLYQHQHASFAQIVIYAQLGCAHTRAVLMKEFTIVDLVSLHLLDLLCVGALEIEA